MISLKDIFPHKRIRELKTETYEKDKRISVLEEQLKSLKQEYNTLKGSHGTLLQKYETLLQKQKTTSEGLQRHIDLYKEEKERRIALEEDLEKEYKKRIFSA